jgi:cellulase/cellobiase CelA1
MCRSLVVDNNWNGGACNVGRRWNNQCLISRLTVHYRLLHVCADIRSLWLAEFTVPHQVVDPAADAIQDRQG